VLDVCNEYAVTNRRDTVRPPVDVPGRDKSAGSVVNLDGANVGANVHIIASGAECCYPIRCGPTTDVTSSRVVNVNPGLNGVRGIDAAAVVQQTVHGTLGRKLVQ